MTKYALVRDGAFIEKRDYAEKPVDIPHKGIQWLPFRHESAPDINPDTEVLNAPTIAIVGSEVVQTYTKRNKTAEELDADKDSRVSATDRLLASVLFDLINEVRALKVPPQAALTKAQFLAYLKNKAGAL